MEVNVKLYGTLSRPVDNYDHQGGLDVLIPDGASIQDLLLFLSLDSGGIGMIFMDGRPAKRETLLKQGAQIRIFQPIFGG